MQFTSVTFMLFLGVAVAVYYALPGARSRTLWLLAASLAFYASLSAAWTLVLVAIVVVGYAGGLAIDAAVDDSRRKRRLAASLMLVIGTLAVFKYATFASVVVRDLARVAGLAQTMPLARLALPVGISFWTFQTIAYLVDVRRGRLRPERDLARYALFVSFFAHVTAGPIARGEQLLPQLEERHRFDYDGMRSALLLMGRGFFKKLVVADPLAVVVNTVYADPRAWPGSTHGSVLLVATLAFAVQIYCDFSGYTDIVRGAARLFGIDLLPNFDRPYFSRSVKEFWRRWHMSLMNWLKEYVYFPLGGSRVSTVRRYVNVLAVFLVSGLWHGAGYTFIVWGLLNGAYQVAGDLTEPLRARMARLFRLNRDRGAWPLVQTVVTFVLVSIAWVFFRAGSLSDALYIVPRMFVPTPGAFSDGSFLHMGLAKPLVMVALAGALAVFAADALSLKWDLASVLARQHVAVRWLSYLALVFVIVVFGYYGPLYSASGFAYFKF